MVLETQPIVFLQWFPAALLTFLVTAAVLGVAALAIGYLITAFRYGPVQGGDITFGVIKSGVLELFQLSPRRVAALSWLAVQEALRRRVLVAFGIFLVILLFAGWFLGTNSNDPGTLYMSVLLNLTSYLVLPIALFLSAFSLPADIKNHTIYTVVTKPVRPGEIILGRILGFTAVCSVFLAIMGLFSYIFLIRVLDHTHEVTVSSVKSIPNDAGGGLTGQTNMVQGHRHEVTLNADGSGITDTKNGHWHQVTAKKVGDKTSYVLGPPQGLLVARVPVYGKLRFKDNNGRDGRGISVGSEWTYRSYIEGRTPAAAVWTFHNVTPERFPDGLPLEMTVRVFRSYKGDIETGIQGTLAIKNPEKDAAGNQVSSQLEFFRAKDAIIDRHDIPRALKDASGKPLDLFKDLVDKNGDVEIWLQCQDAAQYFGVAQPDLYLRAGDAWFALNFIKGYLGIGLQMVLVTSFGVMFSTFLNGAVAMLATVGILVMGTQTEFISKLAEREVKGGGPFESLIRIVNQQNMTSEMEEGLTKTVVQNLDWFVLSIMEKFALVLPNVGRFSSSDHVAHGFNIPGDTVLAQSCTTLTYLCGVFVVGYFFLKTREIAR